ncbi:MAG TPA: response regulator [Chitinophagales bacterium]|nr:response regulator [Chitinophagales bacterium]
MANNEFKILIADDEPDIIEFVAYNLQREGYALVTAADGLEAVMKAKEHKPDLILLDIMMPRMDGVQACEHLRSLPEFQNTLVVFLTALGDEQSEIKGLNVGADDYIVKPIKPKLLISRVKALLRRFQPDDGNVKYSVGDFTFDREQHLVLKNGSMFNLPRKEFDLLLLLSSKPGKVFHRDEILSRVWGTDVIVGDRTIDVHIRKLRQRFGDASIQTVKGVGYKFDA